MAEQPVCIRCRHRHRPDLPCWKGRYSKELTALVLRHSRACFMCGRRATEADHLIPRADGGDDSWWGLNRNLYPACRRCNAGKGAGVPVFEPLQVSITGRSLSERWRS